jgi:hypothetical protein
LGGNEEREGCEAKTDGVDEVSFADIDCMPKTEVGWAGGNADEELLPREKALFDALPPGPKTDPVLA